MRNTDREQWPVMASSNGKRPPNFITAASFCWYNVIFRLTFVFYVVTSTQAASNGTARSMHAAHIAQW